MRVLRRLLRSIFAFVLDRLCTPEILGPTLAGPLRELFDDLDGPRLAGHLTGGVLRADLRPLRAIIPPAGMFDLSFLVTVLILFFLFLVRRDYPARPDVRTCGVSDADFVPADAPGPPAGAGCWGQKTFRLSMTTTSGGTASWSAWTIAAPMFW